MLLCGECYENVYTLFLKAVFVKNRWSLEFWNLAYAFFSASHDHKSLLYVAYTLSHVIFYVGMLYAMTLLEWMFAYSMYIYKKKYGNGEVKILALTSEYHSSI
jgi:hypothetical protein